MKKFAVPENIRFNTEKIANPSTFAHERNAASWLYLCGEEFAGMEGGMSYAQVEQAVDRSANVASDPPRNMTVDLARQHVAALDELPRPTMVTCRSGPRASAVTYMYSGLRAGADPEEVIAEAERQKAPFATSDMLKDWVRESILALRGSA